MKRKKKKLIIFTGLFMFFSALAVFGITKNEKIFSEGVVFYEPPQRLDLETKINVEEIKEKMDEMSIEEIEKTIEEIEKEIKRIESKID